MTVSQLASNFKLTRNPLNNFSGTNRGLVVKVKTTNLQSEGFTADLTGSSIFTPHIVSYVRNMGMTEQNTTTDYVLIVTQEKITIDTWSGGNQVNITVNLTDNNGESLFTQRISQDGKNALNLYNGLCESFTLALEQVNWQEIASYLRKPSKDARDEPDVEVRGNGNTALEQTIVRWDVQSRPQGADLFWRVVSKTPEVKNTNNKYLMTTPYEATKSLDIKGLTYQTAGDVRIILRCEKNGYMPQEKEFNVRMVLDQEEISAFFRLVKEEEE
ncbi:MAG: hypothetical protein KBT04_07380 [Bacteroidales bacterium]|nr:hypothetical protein [Candidatus Colimorpha onthohippi]